MKAFFLAGTLLLAFSLSASAQSSAAPTGNSSGRSNAAGATEDTPAGQVTQSAQNKGHSTLVGCLSGPDSNGKYTLRSMSYRTGVDVLGPDGLTAASGRKVKLTGLWKPGDQPAEAESAKKAREFQATEIEVMAAKCEAPSEKTPVSKEKQAKQQQKQKNSATPPASGDTGNPK